MTIAAYRRKNLPGMDSRRQIHNRIANLAFQPHV